MTIVYAALRKWHGQDKKTNSAISRRFLNVTGVQSVSMIARVHVINGKGFSSNAAPLLRLKLKNTRPNPDRNEALHMENVKTNTPAISSSRRATEEERRSWQIEDGVAVSVVDDVTVSQLKVVGFREPELPVTVRRQGAL